MDYSKFDELINGRELAKEVSEIDRNGNGNGEFVEVPDDKYEVDLVDLSLGESKKDGLPRVTAKFRILKGPQKNKYIWAFWGVARSYGMHDLHEFLKDMQPSTEIEFDGNWNHYAEMLRDVLEEMSGKIYFVLDKGKNDKGYPEYRIEDSWEKE